MSADDETEKSHEPTQKRLDDARRRGEVPRSTDVTTAAAYAGFLLYATAFGGQSLNGIGATLSGFVARAESHAALAFAGAARPLLAEPASAIILAILPWFIVPAASALAAIIAQQSFVMAPEKLAPKLSRISIIANAKNKFGASGLFEFAKSTTKLAIYGVILALFLAWRLPELLTTLSLDPQSAVRLLFDLSVRFLFLVLMVAAGIGAIDLLWQRAEHLRKHRMSHQELKEETKESEGDPTLRQTRRQRGYDLATNRMLADVPMADVVVVNPTHVAVALRWSRAKGTAPVCVAKGQGEVARRIREIAAEAGVPIHRDPPTARALLAEVRIGEQIWPEHYQAVAAAIRFAETIRARARAARGPR